MTWLKQLSERVGYLLEVPENSPVYDPTKRHDFIFFFDATNCNPNGDPYCDNMPRQDIENLRGLVTDVCLKRKIRDFVSRVYGTERSNPPDKEGFYLYVKHRGLLVNEHKETAQKYPNGTIEENQKYMRKRYWDVRMFGAVLNVGKEAEEGQGEEPTQGQQKEAGAAQKRKEPKAKKDVLLNGGQCVGPMQLGLAESISEISPQMISIVRSALVNPTDVKIGSKDDKEAASSMPGNKPYLPYALYDCRGHYSANLDKGGLVSPLDLALFWNALRQMFSDDLSSARPGSMKSLAAGVFSHEHRLGNYPAHKLFDLVKIDEKPELKEQKKSPRSFRDYNLILPKDGTIVKGVTFTTLFNDW